MDSFVTMQFENYMCPNFLELKQKFHLWQILSFLAY